MKRDDLLNTPWVLLPLSGKYYGSKVRDSLGNEVFTYWQNDWPTDELREPSPRHELDEFIVQWDEDQEPYYEGPDDNHYESVGAYLFLLETLRRVNGAH